MMMTDDEFQEEPPTITEVTESLATTISRLRTEVSSSERPTVRMKPLRLSEENNVE